MVDILASSHGQISHSVGSFCSIGAAAKGVKEWKDFKLQIKCLTQVQQTKWTYLRFVLFKPHQPFHVGCCSNLVINSLPLSDLPFKFEQISNKYYDITLT